MSPASSDFGVNWRGREVVRVDDLEQPLGEARELGVELELHARAEERGAFEQPLDVGIGDLDALHPQAAGDLGELLGELGSQLAEVAELAVVVVEETRIHVACRA